jgi:drug/metabolite transporter (DMT)-like permease
VNLMAEATAVATVPRRFTLGTQTEAWGYLCGCVLALGASLSFAAARAGIISGLTPADLILMRFGVAGIVLMPLLLRWGLPNLAGIGWRRGLILTVLGGPAFALMQMGGYAFAPLAHGAVIHPASVTILSTGIAAALLGERLSRVHLIGAGLVISGIVLISWQGLHAAVGVGTWVGDLLFFISAMLWAVFTVLIRHWRLPALRAIAVVGQDDHVANRHASWPRQHEHHHVRHFTGLQQTSRLLGFLQLLGRPVREQCADDGAG